MRRTGGDDGKGRSSDLFVTGQTTRGDLAGALLKGDPLIVAIDALLLGQEEGSPRLTLRTGGRTRLGTVFWLSIGAKDTRARSTGPLDEEKLREDLGR